MIIYDSVICYRRAWRVAAWSQDHMLQVEADWGWARSAYDCDNFATQENNLYCTQCTHRGPGGVKIELITDV